MNCRDCEERLYPFLDHELSEAEVATVERHLAECRGCVDHFTFERRVLEKVRDAYAEDRAPDRLRESIVLRLRQH